MQLPYLTSLKRRFRKRLGASPVWSSRKASTRARPRIEDPISTRITSQRTACPGRSSQTFLAGLHKLSKGDREQNSSCCCRLPRILCDCRGRPRLLRVGGGGIEGRYNQDWENRPVQNLCLRQCNSPRCSSCVPRRGSNYAETGS